MNIDSPQPGFLYLLNEGPSAGGVVTYNMVFPAPSVNSGSPEVKADQRIHTGWMVFDEHQGTERFWIVWAAEAVPELESVKSVVNEKEKGAISDESKSKAVRDFINRSFALKPQVETNKVQKETTSKVKAAVLVSSIELEHH
jgi:hypothetical protein